MLLYFISLVYLSNEIFVNSQHILDTHSPIVIYEGSVGDPDWNNNTLFGYSLAFIKASFGVPPPSQGQALGTLFIGAPKETRRSTNSGVVWACQINDNASIKCSILTGISNSNTSLKPQRDCERKGIQDPEKESDQWIGASLTTTKDHRLFACAPRWKLNGFKRWNRYCSSETALTGACYISKSNSIRDNSPFVMNPFYEPDNTPDTMNKFHWYKYAQYGFSSHVTNSGTLLVGIPSSTAAGFFNWDAFNGLGRYVEYLLETNGQLTKKLINRDFAEPYGYEYFGYTLTSGASSGGREYVAVAAPRGNYLAGVVVVNLVLNWNPKLRLVGEQTGAYFGYSLATVDLNGDGDDELLIGAPMYTQQFDTGDDGWNSGCVFVYDVDVNTQSQQQIAKLCLEKEAKGARLGSAISNLGDINFDRKQDFVVAAPYFDDGVGAVFIYYGVIPLTSTPAQVIRGKSIGIPNLRGFGSYLLSGNLDVDGNGTPDLVISSYESNQVVILRTRPIAIPKMKITYHSSDSDGSFGKIYKFLPTERAGFRARICNIFLFSVANSREIELDVWIKLEMDKRLEFVEVEGTSNAAEFKHFLSSTRKDCLDIQLRMKSDFIGEESKDPIQLRAGITFNTTQALDESEPILQENQAILNLSRETQSGSTFQTAFGSFKKLLPAPIQWTYSEWEPLEIVMDNCESDGNSSCNPNLKLKLDFLYENENGENIRGSQENEKIFNIGQVETLVLKITLANDGGETAYRPRIKISLNFSENFEVPKNTEWQWKLTEPLGKTEEFIEKNNTSILGEFGRTSRPLQHNTHNLYEIRVSNLRQLKVKESLTGTLRLNILAFPEGQQEDEKVELKIEIPLEGKVNVEIQAEAPATDQQSSVDPNVNRVDLSQIFILNNTGISSMAEGKVKVELFVPTHIPMNNTLMQVIGVVNPSQYISTIHCDAHDFSFYNPESVTASTNTRPSTVSSVASFLQLRTEPDKSRPILPTSNQLITLSGCSASRASANCRKIICTTDLPSGESRAIRLHMFALPETITYLTSGETTGIRIQTSISVTYLKTMVKRGEGSTTRMFLMERGIPAWMILVAGAGGVIILLLVTLALHKCGFFRRKKKAELNTLKRQTQVWLEFNNLDVPWLKTEDEQT